MISSWENFKAKIPSFYNSALRFAFLRTVCVFSIALLCTVPSTVVLYTLEGCKEQGVQNDLGMLLDYIQFTTNQYEVHRMVYSYVLYGFTLFHHFVR